MTLAKEAKILIPAQHILKAGINEDCFHDHEILTFYRALIQQGLPLAMGHTYFVFVGDSQATATSFVVLCEMSLRGGWHLHCTKP